MSVRIERQREQARAKDKDTSPKKPLTNKKLREAARHEHLDTQVLAAVRHTYGTQKLDLKSLELVRIPRAAIFQTLLLQFARCVQTVNVSRNALRELPDSFIRAFPEVEIMLCKENALARLPSRALGELRYLRVLNVSGNQIDALPTTLPDTLETLDASRNRLQDIHNLHTLTHLASLDLSNNHFQLLPCGIMALNRLQTLTVSGNRLVTLATRPQLTRRRTIEDDSAVVPQDEETSDEATDENNEAERKNWRIEVDPVSRNTVYYHVQSKRVTRTKPKCFQVRVPRLQLPGNQSQPQKKDNRALLERFPEDESFSSLPAALDRLGDVAYLHTLILSSNELLELPPSIGELKRLKRLEAENNKLLALPDTFHKLQALETVKLALEDLDLRYNRLEVLPDTFGNCTKLKVLRASNNALVSLPESMTGLANCLVDLQLAHNQLVNAPHALSALHALERLDLSFNRLETLDELDFSQLSRLQVLRLSGNRLTELPLSLGGIVTTDGGKPPPIRELTFAGNMIKEFPPAVLLLGPTLQQLEMQSNRLERLPISFGVALSELKIVESDGNPFRSPPAQIMRLGAKSIRAYLSKREQRVDELATLLTALGLKFDRETFDRPIMRHLLPPGMPLTNLSFLTAKHLEAFDRAIDSYVNGAFYLPPPPKGAGPMFRRGADIMQELLLSTHFELAQRHHRTILDELLRLLALIREKRWADKTDLRYDMLRPWGRHGEQVGVYTVRGAILFPEDYKSADDAAQPPVSPGKELPSVLRVVETRTQRGFPPEPFVENKRTARDVERALEQYVGHYGPVGVAHARVPMRCSCEGLLRFGKMHDPCEQRGWTMVRVLYTDEEVARRELDEQRLRDAQDALLPQIQAFLNTPEGEKRFHREVKNAKDSLRIHLRALNVQLKRHHAKWKPLAKAYAREEKVEKKLEHAAQQAAKSKKPGEVVPVRRQETLSEVKARVAKREKLEFAAARVREDIEELERGKARLGQGYAAFREEVERVLLEKVGVSVRHHLVRQQRDKAIAMDWRRPWDGIDGRAFQRYQREIRRHQQGGADEEGAGASPKHAPKSVLKSSKGKADESSKNGNDNDGDDDAVASDDNSEISDVSFDGYDDLVANMGREPASAVFEDDDDEDEESVAIAEAARAAAMAALEAEEAERAADDLDDSSDGDDDDGNLRESEDSDL
ncbi:hypothetical protein BBO99_00002535 [Phytophthora kernoviae]|uniref:WW domain-containing protein n=1 Tax=Phytophthora kernoviae TaxID=325452 RepID=A0A421GWF8_9STRA|nr:hypothetical protein JM16_004907 [Phytophthora kernoviae]RLN82936.1 hypothetical protein BBO99_00002535 [Phytophthora kernoviae]